MHDCVVHPQRVIIPGGSERYWRTGLLHGERKGVVQLPGGEWSTHCILQETAAHYSELYIVVVSIVVKWNYVQTFLYWWSYYFDMSVFFISYHVKALRSWFIWASYFVFRSWFMPWQFMWEDSGFLLMHHVSEGLLMIEITVMICKVLLNKIKAVRFCSCLQNGNGRFSDAQQVYLKAVVWTYSNA